METTRSRPALWDRDYWCLRRIRTELDAFLREHAPARGQRARALDFGAGDTPYAGVLGAAGFEVTAADLDPPPGGLRIGSDGTLPIADGCFDVVVSTQVLEHVIDVGCYLAEARRVLGPGGAMFLSTHGTFLLHRHPTDMRRWTVDGLRYELDRAGFTAVTVAPRVGILAATTHHRAIVYGSVLRRIPGLSVLRPWLYAAFNARMALEEALLPASELERLPEILIATARRGP